MNKLSRLIVFAALSALSTASYAQFNESGISAGFFDGSKEQSINFSEFHLPPLAVLFENAKATPQVMSLQKAQEIAEAEVAKQKRHIFSFINGHASYGYGKTDMWGQGQSESSYLILKQYQGSEQSYWNVGVSLSVPLEDILDLSASVKRAKLQVDQKIFEKDMAYDQLKLQIAGLFTKITNDLISLKTASENAAMYQGAGALNLEDFHNGNMSIEEFAWTKTRENGAVLSYQELQTSIITDILTLEIITHTPILTNSTTEITLDNNIQKTEKQIAKENKKVEKRIKKAVEEEEKKIEALEKAEKKAEKAAAKAEKKANKQK
ncbi:MAG: TolC family protein [Prevotella sp.]|nr:TolC family protein [Prevotella sp.]